MWKTTEEQQQTWSVYWIRQWTMLIILIQDLGKRYLLLKLCDHSTPCILIGTLTGTGILEIERLELHLGCSVDRRATHQQLEVL
jgi:hypothetical protein